MPAENNNTIGPDEMYVLAFILKDSPVQNVASMDQLNRGLPGLGQLDTMIAYRRLKAKGLLRQSDHIPSILRVTDEAWDWIGAHRKDLDEQTQRLEKAMGK